jgi:hypothetical protein
MISIELDDAPARQVIADSAQHVFAALLVPEQRLRARQDHANEPRARHFDRRSYRRRRWRNGRLIRTSRHHRQGNHDQGSKQ